MQDDKIFENFNSLTKELESFSVSMKNHYENAKNSVPVELMPHINKALEDIKKQKPEDLINLMKCGNDYIMKKAKEAEESFKKGKDAHGN